ncbi:Gnf1, partial [Symbiodinium sp. KB8]
EELFDLVVASLPKEERAKIMAQAQAEKERQETEELDRLKKIAAAAPAAPPKAEGGGKKGEAAAAAKVPAVAAALWADKYRPQTVADLVGNAVSATLREPSPLHLPVASDALLSPSAGFDQLPLLLRWAVSLHLTGTYVPPPPGYCCTPPLAPVLFMSIAFPLAMSLSCIGKTTAATLVAKGLGFDVFEMNASDQRSRRLLESSMSEVLDNQVLSFGTAQPRSRVIIMDEVRGLDPETRHSQAPQP